MLLMVFACGVDGGVVVYFACDICFWRMVMMLVCPSGYCVHYFKPRFVSK